MGALERGGERGGAVRRGEVRLERAAARPRGRVGAVVRDDGEAVAREVARDRVPHPHAGAGDERDAPLAARSCRARAQRIPRRLLPLRALVRHPRGDEEEVGEPVQVRERLGRRPPPRRRAPRPAARRGGRRSARGGAPPRCACRRAARTGAAAGAPRPTRRWPPRAAPSTRASMGGMAERAFASCGVASSAPTQKSSCCTRARWPVDLRDPRRWRAPTPIAAFSSSTSP